MKIKHGEYVIEGTTGDWIVSRLAICQDKKSKNYGKEYETDRAYFGRLYQVLNYLLDTDMADGAKSSVRQLIAEIHSIGKHIKVTADNIERSIKNDL